MERGEGERLHNQQRRRFWTILGALAGLGLIIGLIIGFVAGFADTRDDVDPLVVNLAAAGVVLFGLGAVYGSWRFFVTVDELELADNLWGSMIGFYVYGILFPCWWALSMLHRAPEPNQWVIYAASLLSGAAAYGYRKWSNR